MPPGLVADLLAAVLAAGADPRSAVTAVEEGLAAVGDPAAAALGRLAGQLESADRDGVGPCPALAPVEQSLLLSVRTGAAPADLVRRAATGVRRAEAARSAVAAARLPVLLVLPLGLCLLPASVLLGVAPVVLDLLAESLGGAL